MNKKIISVLLVLSMLIGMLAMLPITIGAAEVTADNADIVIKSVDDWIEDLSNGNSIGSKTVFVEAKELDFTGKTVKPIKDFSGKFNGNGVVIKNLSIVTAGETGMFGCSKAGSEPTIVENFVITDSYFEGKKWVGAVFCCVSGDVTVRNVFVSSSVEVHATGENAGGIIGAPATGGKKITIEDCVVAATVQTESKYSGGITGRIHRSNNNVVINNCLVTGKTRYKGGDNSSGFVGVFEAGSLEMNNCIYAGGAEGKYFTSYPFVKNTDAYGNIFEVTINNCYTTHACSDKAVTVDKTYEDEGITYLNNSRDSLIGKNCSTTVDGFTKRDGDIMIPNGVANFASTGIFCKFTVTWKNYDGTVLDTDEVLAGETPEYKGEEIPTRPEDTQFIYTFSGNWSPAITAVNSDITYTAKFDREIKNNIPEGYYDVWDGTSDDSYTSFGSGTEEDPYIIRTAEQWANLAEATADGIDDGLYFELAVNLDFNDIEGLKPISPDGKKTLIYFDGKGHTIKGVNMTWSKDGTGLFGDVWGSANPEDRAEKTSVIENFYITESVFNGGKYVGALIGEVSGNVIVSNIYVDSSVVVRGSGTEEDEECSVGGIIGGCYYGSSWKPESKVIECTLEVNDCVFAGRVLSSGTKNGGIVGNGNSKVEKDKEGNITQWELFHIVINNSLVTGYVQHDKDRSNGFVGHNDHTCKDSDGNVYTYEDRTEFTASVTLNGCIYAGGAEDVYFYNRPFFGTVTTPTVNNCYTTHTAANGVYNNVKWTKENSGVTLVGVDKLLGTNATAPAGWTKREGDLAIPDGVADFAPATFTLKMLDGASVRLDTPTGLRFKAVLGDVFLNSIKSANAGKTVTYGIIITPTDYVVEAGNVFTVEALAQLAHSTNYILVPAEKLMSGGEADGYYLFSAVIANVQEYNYTRAFSARAYVAVDDGNGNVEYYYSAYDSAVNSRTIAEVAEAAYNDTSKTQNDEYKYEITANAGIYSPYKEAQRNLLPDFYGKVAENVNLMTYNIRNVEGGDSRLNDPLTFEYDGREDAVVNYILSANPDVVGIQEASVKTHAYNNSSTLSWFDTLAELEAKGYACYKGLNILPSSDNKEMYNPIYYKADKYNLVDSGFAYLSEDGTQRAYSGEYRGVTYVVLEDKTTGLQFVYVNVHMTRYNSTDNYQDDVAGYLKSFLDGLTYTCPIFIGGDFNGSYTVYKGYDTFWGEKAVSARDKATNKTSGCSATNDTFDDLGTATGPIDLYFAMNTDTVDFHNYAVTDNKVEATGLYPSDHLPVKLLVTVYGDKTAA